MYFISSVLRRFADEEGQSMVEYALIIALIVVGALIVFASGVADSTADMYENNMEKIVDALGGP